MEHNDAVEQKATEKYLLNELDPAKMMEVMSRGSTPRA